MSDSIVPHNLLWGAGGELDLRKRGLLQPSSSSGVNVQDLFVVARAIYRKVYPRLKSLQPGDFSIHRRLFGELLSVVTIHSWRESVACERLLWAKQNSDRPAFVSVFRARLGFIGCSSRGSPVNCSSSCFASGAFQASAHPCPGAGLEGSYIRRTWRYQGEAGRPARTRKEALPRAAGNGGTQEARGDPVRPEKPERGVGHAGPHAQGVRAPNTRTHTRASTHARGLPRPRALHFAQFSQNGGEASAPGTCTRVWMRACASTTASLSFVSSAHSIPPRSVTLLPFSRSPCPQSRKSLSRVPHPLATHPCPPPRHSLTLVPLPLSIILDRSMRHQERLEARRALEESWATNVTRKKGAEDLERRRALSPGMLIHEQGDKYRRCKQCGRRPGNCGESNVWSESRYIPGSRLMVWPAARQPHFSAGYLGVACC